jgi:hypothetical protein
VLGKTFRVEARRLIMNWITRSQKASFDTWPRALTRMGQGGLRYLLVSCMFGPRASSIAYLKQSAEYDVKDVHVCAS